MNNELSIPVGEKKTNALGAMASRLSVEPERLHEVLKATAFKACKNDEQFAALVIVSNEYGLNPLTKEVYAFPGKGGEIVPIVSIDGWLRIINDHPQMDGMTERWADDASWCEVTIYRKDRSHPTIHREHIDEVKRNTDPWKQHPRRMLKWKTIIQTGRVAFGFGGIHDEEEGSTIAMREASGKVIDEPESQENPFGKIGNAENERSSLMGEAQSDGHEEPEPEGATSTSGSTPKERPEGNLIEVTYLSKQEKSGTTKGKKWTRYGFNLALGEEQVWAGTFSGSLGEMEFKKGDQVAVILAKKEEGKYDLLWIEEATTEKGGAK